MVKELKLSEDRAEVASSILIKGKQDTRRSRICQGLTNGVVSASISLCSNRGRSRSIPTASRLKGATCKQTCQTPDPKKDLLHVTCYECGPTGHYANTCPTLTPKQREERKAGKGGGRGGGKGDGKGKGKGRGGGKLLGKKPDGQ